MKRLDEINTKLYWLDLARSHGCSSLKQVSEKIAELLKIKLRTVTQEAELLELEEIATHL